MQKSQFFFLCAIATIPIQLNKFFFTDSSLVLGIPIDYRALSLYLSDIPVILTITFFVLTLKSHLIHHIRQYQGYVIPLFMLVAYLLVAPVVSSQDSRTSLIFAVNIVEVALFSIVSLYFLKDKKTLFKTAQVLKISLAWQSILAIIQFLSQKSLGLYFLGERSFDSSTTAIAHAQVLNSQFLRSYGTFPHPNVLAAYILTSVAILKLLSARGNTRGNTKVFTPNNILYFIALCALLVTFSKTAVVLLAALIIFESKTPKVAILKLVAISALALAYFGNFSQAYVDTLAERLVLLQAALAISKDNLLLGVGSNNFILEVAKLNLISIGEVRLLQPVHNVFLLVLAENGIAGLMAFSFFIFQVIKKSSQKIAIFLSVLLLLYSMVDHFFWTLQQGQLIFFLSSAVIYSSKSNT